MRTGLSIKSHAVLYSLIRKGFIREWRPGEYRITSRGKDRAKKYGWRASKKGRQAATAQADNELS